MSGLILVRLSGREDAGLARQSPARQHHQQCERCSNDDTCSNSSVDNITSLGNELHQSMSQQMSKIVEKHVRHDTHLDVRRIAVEGIRIGLYELRIFKQRPHGGIFVPRVFFLHADEVHGVGDDLVVVKGCHSKWSLVG